MALLTDTGGQWVQSVVHPAGKAVNGQSMALSAGGQSHKSQGF